MFPDDNTPEPKWQDIPENKAPVMPAEGDNTAEPEFKDIPVNDAPVPEQPMYDGGN